MSKPRGRPFEPGNKFGRGRPKGSRNRKVTPAVQLLKQYEPDLTRRLIGMALQGNAQALRICMERLVPAPHDACVPITLPKIKSAGDVATAAEQITRGMGRGNLSPSEGEKMMSVLESQSRVIENAEIERRLEKLEDYVATTNKTHSV